MPNSQNINLQEESAVKELSDLILKNYKLFILCMAVAIGVAFFINRYSTPYYSISSSILIRENRPQQNNNASDFLNSSLFGRNQSFQNEFWIMKSYPIVEKTVRNLDLSVTYFTKGKFNYYETYQNAPFRVSYIQDHVQPVNVMFRVTPLGKGSYIIDAESKKVSFYNSWTNKTGFQREKWSFNRTAKFGELIETPELAFILEARDTSQNNFEPRVRYGFNIRKVTTISNEIRRKLAFNLVDKQATVININLRSESVTKGIDIVNELMNVYSEQNLGQKNHLATITIDYIEKQLGEISDSLSQTEEYLQRFRSSKQLLNITDQATGLATQRINLQNQLAEIVARKKYYDYVSDMLKNDNFANIMLPASIGISDQLLNNLMSELINAQAQRSNLIQNNQERNPMVQKLGLQINNLKKTITENIAEVAKSTSMSADEMTNRLRRLEGEISLLPATQRQLGTIERKYNLNEAIYNYLMEKHAEAKITKASNLPDDLIIEPAKMTGNGPVSPNKSRNYLIAFVLGLVMPFGFVIVKKQIDNKIESQDDIEAITNRPLVAKILHNNHKTQNVMFDYPSSNIAESFRVLRTNLDFYLKGEGKKVIMVTSCLEHEGKSFISQNLAMSYAQLGRKTVLVDFDLRKPKVYFREGEETRPGLSSYMINKIQFEDLICKSPHPNLDYILSGILPPNPVELIALEKTKILISRLKETYEIIVLDTTPLAQVTDAYLLIDSTDARIIIARYNSTLKSVFSLINKDLTLKDISDVYIVLNDNRQYRDQYGYGYGYYDKKSHKKRRKKVKEDQVKTDKPKETNGLKAKAEDIWRSNISQ